MKTSAKIITGVVIVGVLAAMVLPRYLKKEELADPGPTSRKPHLRCSR